MLKNRVAGIVIREGKVLVIHRFNKGEEYYVFPGGGQEKDETSKEAVIREMFEETSLKVVPKKLLYHITWDENIENFFYLCDEDGAEAKFQEDSEEYVEMQKSDDQVYKLEWIPIEDLSKLKLYQLEVRDLFIEDYKMNFSGEVKELFIKVAERRQA
jgi:8-oxo-dGTP pyrophosphatase MutT (NUDIX family)